MKEVVGIGVIGVGARVAAVVKRLVAEAGGRLKVSAIYDPDPKAVEDAEGTFGSDIAVCSSEDELVRQSECEWVFIGSPNCFHAQHAIKALEAGKNVFCEKPLATELEDCFAIKKAVAESGRKFAFGLVLRYSPHYQKVYELVNSGAIGRIVSFEFNETLHFTHGGYIFGNWRRSKEVAGSHLLEKCCHDLDLANWLIGSRPSRVASFGGRDFFTPENAGQIERIGLDSEGRNAYGIWKDHRSINPFTPGADIVDHQVAILEYESGVKATFHTNCNTAMAERRFYLCGTEGTLKADSITGIIEIQRIGHDVPVEIIKTTQSEDHYGGDAVMAQSLINTIFENAAPLANIDHGISAFLVAHAIDEALEQGRVVDLGSLWQRLDAVATAPSEVDLPESVTGILKFSGVSYVLAGGSQVFEIEKS